MDGNVRKARPGRRTPIDRKRPDVIFDVGARDASYLSRRLTMMAATMQTNPTTAMATMPWSGVASPICGIADSPGEAGVPPLATPLAVALAGVLCTGFWFGIGDGPGLGFGSVVGPGVGPGLGLGLGFGSGFGIGLTSSPSPSAPELAAM